MGKVLNSKEKEKERDLKYFKKNKLLLTTKFVSQKKNRIRATHRGRGDFYIYVAPVGPIVKLRNEVC